MKRILFLFSLLLMLLAGQAQKHQFLPGYGFQWNRGIFDVTLGVPYADNAPGSPGTNVSRPGYLFYSSQDSTVSYWTASRWIQMATKAKTVDSIYRISGKDSIFFRLGGQVFRIRDSIGSGGGGGGLSGGNIGSGYRWYVSSSQSLKTVFNGYGILWDSSSNTNGLTAKFDSTVVFPQLRATIPAGAGASYTFTQGLQQVAGVVSIDNKREIPYIVQPSTGSSLGSQWVAVGSPSYTVVNGKFVFTGGSNNFTSYLRTNVGVLSENCYVEWYTIINSVGSTDQGPRVGFKSYNTHSFQHDVHAGIVLGTSDANVGKTDIYGSTGNSHNYSTSARTSYQVNDTIYNRLTRIGLEYVQYSTNITRGWKVTNKVTINPQTGGNPFVGHNSSYIEVIPGAGSYTIYGLRYVTVTPVVTELAMLGNSITYGQSAASEAARYMSRVGVPSMNIGSGGGADGTAEVLGRVGEIIKIHPAKVLLMIGGNDILFGVSAATWKANYTAIRDSFVANGIAVIHLLPTPRTATDVSDLKLFIDTSSTFRSDYIIDTWTPLLGTGTSLKAKYNYDNTHPNELGMGEVAAVINEGLHYPNGFALQVNRNLFAKNGYVLGSDNGTGPDQYKSGGLIASKINSLTQYVQIGYHPTLSGGTIQSITEGASYDALFINPAGGYVGLNETSPAATLHVSQPGAGNQIAGVFNHKGSYSAVGQYIGLNFANANSYTGAIRNAVGPGSTFDMLVYSYNSAINSTPNIYAAGTGKTGINISTGVPISTLHVAGAARITDTLITPNILLAGLDTTNYKLVVVDANGVHWKTNWQAGGVGGGGVSSVSAGLGMGFSTITSSGAVAVDTAVGTGVIMWPRLNKLKDSLISLMGGGSYIVNGFGGAQSARFWIAGSGQSDSAFVGRTNGASSGFKTGGLRALASSGTTSYLQIGYDATLAAGWFQAVTEGSAYRDVIFNAAGGNVGIGTLTTLPTTLVQLQKANYPAIKFLKTGVNPWYIGNRTEGSGTDFQISYNTTDWMQMKITGETGLGNVSPREVLDVNGQISYRGAVAGVSTDSIYTQEDGRIKTIDLSALNANYFYNPGRAGGQTMNGGANANDGLIIKNNAATSGNTAGNGAIQFRVGNTKFTSLYLTNDGVVYLQGGTGQAIVDVTTTTTLDGTMKTVLVNATSGNITINLPAASTYPGIVYTIKKTDASANTVTIDGNGSETIDTALTKVISTQNTGSTIQSYGSSWFIIP